MKRRKQGLLWVLIALVGFIMAVSGVSFSDLMKPFGKDVEMVTAEEVEPEAGPSAAPVVILSPQRRQHILYGDQSGGGHFHTADKPCKSEFPESWSEERIVTTIKKIAANDNLTWRQENNGYKVAEQTSGTLLIRVVKDGNRIITAYPTNVERNPCPGRTPSNDNYNQ